MKKYKTIYLFICLLYVYNYVHAQNEVASPRIMQYVQEHKDMAIEEMLRTGVPASITLAQDILESNCGESELCKISHNHFGIKCKNNWTGPTVLYDDDKPNECFRVYTSDIDSYRDHSNFIRNRPYYASLFDINPIEYKQWAMALTLLEIALIMLLYLTSTPLNTNNGLWLYNNVGCHLFYLWRRAYSCHRNLPFTTIYFRCNRKKIYIYHACYSNKLYDIQS